MSARPVIFQGHDLANPAAEGFLGTYKWWIIIGLIVAIGIGVYFFIQWRNSKKDDEVELQMRGNRMAAEQYAAAAAQVQAARMVEDLRARQSLASDMTNPGTRHDLGDPGIMQDLPATHDWEAPVNQRSAPEGIAITTDTAPIGMPTSDPNANRPISPASTE